MARPQKTTVNYFPHESNASTGKTLFILESKYGNDGYAFWFKLLELLCSTPGMVYDAGNPANWEFLLAKTRVDGDTAGNLLETLAGLNAIDQELYVSKRFIWSDNLVKNVSDAFRKRIGDTPNKPVIGDGNGEESPNPAPETGKLKETILKEIKGNYTTGDNGDIFLKYENEIGSLTQTIALQIGKWIDALNSKAGDWIPEAIDIAVKNNVRKWSYVESILKDWEAKGFKDTKRKDSKTESTHGDGWQ